jgi:hypothetical protein
MVMLNCKPPQNLGGIRVNGTFNICSDLVRVVVAPLQTSVGNDIALSASGADFEGEEILYRWEATNGSIAHASAPDTNYTCTSAGNHAVRVEVSDDDFDYGISDWRVAITCVDGEVVECEIDGDCEAGEVCEQDVCVPDVECNVDEDCAAGEVCVVNLCMPDVECNVAQDCAAGEICVGKVCVPDVECNVDQDCPAGEIGFANECVPDLECSIDQDCPLGEICIANECVTRIECNLDADCPAGEVCVDNTCVPDIKCSVDEDCDDDNECTIGVCNIGGGVCNNSNVQDGTVCDGGNGLCAVGECRTNELLGTDFVIVFEANYLRSQLTLGLSGPQATNGVISISSIGFSQPFSVTPGSVTTVALPPGSEVISNDVVEAGAAVRVVSEKQITVYGLNRLLLSTDAFAALPVEVLGQRYRVAAWSGGVNGPSQLAIAPVPAFEGDTTTPTTVTITPAAAAGTRPAGLPYTVVLRPLDAYQLQSEGDLTGSLIESNRPVSVFGGNSCANIPNQQTGFCDHVVEQLPPVSIWGTEAFTVPLATRTSGDTFRIIADQSGTQVQLEGATSELISLNAGAFAERNLIGSYRITANAPILVSQFSNGTEWDGVTSDPFMMLIPSAAQFIRTYTFATPGSGFPVNYANIVALTTDVSSGSVLLDGASVPAGSFTALAGTQYSTAQVPISVGSHTLISSNPLGLYVYGYAAFDSYGYPGGFSTGNGLLP